ncbi:hypothetical protein C4J81_00065 [Deltaproteobacteria bacterium Smac51]|nr:hypothetical protein C4J81_00065 [Deltaproteobacteria bacterium Smac51]
MDIWAWVDKLTDELEEAGQSRLASLFYRIPDLRSQKEMSQAEALLPEALAAARAMENPWVELFFRHQEMRVRLGNKVEGESALPAVVDLLDFAHQKGCAGCPQVVCTTHDVANCYGNIDGPGWVEERKAVCRETLEGIDSTWICFSCVSREYAEALADEGKLEEAIEYYRQAMRKWIDETDIEEDARDHETLAEYYLRMDSLDEAEAEVATARQFNEKERNEAVGLDLDLSAAYIMARRGQLEEAWELLPPFSDLIPSSYRSWARAAGALAEADLKYNSWQLASIFLKMMDYFEEVGAPRRVLEIGELNLRLALARSSLAVATRSLVIMERQIPRLHKTLGADDLVAGLKARVADMPRKPLPVPADKLLDHLRETEHGDPEEALEWLYAALEERPDDVDIVLWLSSALSALNSPKTIRELLWDFINRYPALSEPLVDEFIRQTPETDLEELERLATALDKDLPRMAQWSRLYRAYRSGRLDDVAELAQKVLDNRPEALGARLLWARAAMNHEEYATAARLYNEVVELTERDEDHDGDFYRWDLMVAATCCGDWAKVREAGIALGMRIEPGDGPINDDDGNWVRICYDEDGQGQTVFGFRNGPVTARITSCSWPGRVQHLQDWVVFDPAPLEEAPEDEEALRYYAPPYRLVKVLGKGGYTSWFVDGAHPGEAAWNEFLEKMDKEGLIIDERSNDDYTVKDPAAPEDDSEESRLPGLYFLIGSPSGYSPAALDGLLSELTAGWPHPAAWLNLAKAAGKPVEKHQDTIERYDL